MYCSSLILDYSNMFHACSTNKVIGQLGLLTSWKTIHCTVLLSLANHIAKNISPSVVCIMPLAKYLYFHNGVHGDIWESSMRCTIAQNHKNISPSVVCIMPLNTYTSILVPMVIPGKVHYCPKPQKYLTSVVCIMPLNTYTSLLVSMVIPGKAA